MTTICHILFFAIETSGGLGKGNLFCTCKVEWELDGIRDSLYLSDLTVEFQNARANQVWGLVPHRFKNISSYSLNESIAAEVCRETSILTEQSPQVCSRFATTVIG